MTDIEHARRKGIEQFVQRYNAFFHIEKIDNSKLLVGQPMYFYCNHCGILIEVLPEDYLMPPYPACSQCFGLQKEGWLNLAKAAV